MSFKPVLPDRTLLAFIAKTAQTIHRDQVKWRRYLHQHPETANEEFETTRFLTERVKRMGLKVRRIDMPTGVLAELRGKRPGPTVAIRSDIDALPVHEETGLPFCSKTPGRMHACGHDMHMATVLGAAAILTRCVDQLAGTVRFIFQPAEERPPGGARPMIANGALEKVEMIFGLHVDPHIPTGKIGIRDGVTMASVYDFNLTIHGRSGHAARPHTAVDAIVVASEIVGSLQTIVSREVDPMTPVAITFGKIEGGVARNVIAQEVKLTGTARTLSKSAQKQLPRLIKRTVAGICRARGASYTLEPIATYPVLSNSPETNAIFNASFTGLFGRGRVGTMSAGLGGEDFACYLEHVPGAMCRLGVMNRKIGADRPWHSPQFIADEAALPYGSALLAASVFTYTNSRRKR